MRKKLFSILSAVFIMLSMFTASVSAEDDILPYLTYEITDGEVTITDCNTSISGDIVIPDTIEGYPVTVIGESSFSECTGLTGVTLPDSVKTIKKSAFYMCVRLSSVEIPRGVESIENSTFSECISLTTVKLNEGLKYIYDGAFAYCISLTDLNIPSGVEQISAAAFIDCPNIEVMVIPDSVKNISTLGISACGFNDIYIYGEDTVLDEYSIGYYFCEITGDPDVYIELHNEWLMVSHGLKSDYNGYTESELSDITYSMLGDGDFTPISDFTIHGYEGSTAQTYAEENGFNFVALCRHNYVDSIITPATYSQAGEGGEVCEYCGDILSTYEIPVLEIENSEKKEDFDTGVSVIFPDGTFEDDADVEIKVTPVEEGDAYKLISHKQGNYKVTMFDISITADGEKVQPNGTVLVKMPLPKGYNQNKCVVYYVADDGTMEELKTYHYKDGYVYFETDHFSYYAVLENTEISSDGAAWMNESLSFIDKLIAFFNAIKDFFKNIFSGA